ncbi:DNA repair protein RecO [uncultured Ruthenibacterium sp.]|mgnify:CR=1 FL=1|uniref:DNA repair protein RecO n=1 Tax=uncultured Ruthenibacterium sp. TaxID=1905347 RepID=UPI00349E851C
MQTITKGLVLRSTKTNEADRVLVLLTPEQGIVSAMAKGALRLKNKLFSGTGLFCYSEFALFQGKSMYIVDDAQVQNVFYGIHDDMENMALAMYFSEITMTLSPVGEEAQSMLRLLLNTFYLMSEHKKSSRFLKSIFELRALSLAGFMPDLVACTDCAKYEGGPFYFDTHAAKIYCAECAKKRQQICNLDPSALAAMRHIVFSADEKLFSFRLGEQSEERLSAVVANYLSACLDKPLKTADFLNTILS